MKSILNSLFSTVMILLITSACSSDDLEDLATTTIPVSLSKDVHISVISDPLTFSETVVLDASSTVSNLKIEEYKITKLTIKITNYTGNATKISDLSMAVVGTNLTINVADIVFADVNNVGAINIQDGGGIFAALAAEFVKDNSLTLAVNATVDNKPVDFDMEFTVEGTVTGSLVK